MLEEFAKQIAEYYERKGDPIAAGIQFAWLPDKKMWYYAVHRFPTRKIESRIVVAKAIYHDPKIALNLLKSNWEYIRVEIEKLDAEKEQER